MANGMKGETYGGFQEKSSQIKEKAAWEGLFGPIHLLLLEMLRCEIVQLGAAAVFRVLWKETLHAHQRSNTERLKEQGPQWHFWAFETLWDNLFPILEVPFKCYLENVHPYGLNQFICISCYLQPRTFLNNKVDNFQSLCRSKIVRVLNNIPKGRRGRGSNCPGIYERIGKV